MKKILSLILTLMILASVWVIVPAAYAEEGQYYVYTANGKALNMRIEPNKNAKVIMKLQFGDEFWVTETLGGGWSYGHFGGQFGYVMTRFLTKDKPAKKPGEETPEEKERRQEQEKLADELASEKEVNPFYVAVVATRATGYINFRIGPSKITARVASYPDGKELIVQGETTNWYKATDPDTESIGYINKNFVTVLAKPLGEAAEEVTEGSEKLGKLNVNGEFDLTCKLPEGYKLQVVNVRGGKIVASLLSEDITQPQMYLNIAYDETYGEVERMNDMSEEDLKILENSFKELNEVEITYRETGYGTKLLMARETGSDDDFVDILAIYKGYFIEFNMTPSPDAANKELTDEQVQMCIDFLTNVDFVPTEKAE